MARKPVPAAAPKGIMAIIKSEGVGGLAARRLLPFALGLPVSVGLLSYAGERVGLYGPFVGVVLAVLALTAAAIVVVARVGGHLNEEEDAREKGEIKAKLATKKALADLEARMAARTRELDDEKTKAVTLLECIGDGVFVIDRYWMIQSWNAAAETISGFSKEDAIGKQFREIVKFIHESDRTPNLAFIEECMLFGKTKFIENHTLMIRKDGSEVPVGDSAAPVFDKDGKVAGAIVVFRDVTKDHEVEAARQEFASLATHQLRTPITVIKGYAELLADGKATFNERQQSALAGIEKAAERLNALVTAMLNVTRIESGAVDVAPELSSLSDIADEVAKEMASQVEAKQQILTVEHGPEVPAVSVDPRLVGAIFRNLLSNAVKYTPEGGKITFKIAKTERNVLITVSDTGFGIPKLQQPKMFAKFFRAENVRRKEIEGTGLGLYLVKSILESAGGNITFVSEENRGTTFTITIPLTGMKRREGTKGLS